LIVAIATAVTLSVVASAADGADIAARLDVHRHGQNRIGAWRKSAAPSDRHGNLPDQAASARRQRAGAADAVGQATTGADKRFVFGVI
jgi:hypothetical protein